MQMTPVKTKSVFRHIWIKLILWETIIRMKELHGNPDVWFTKSIPPKNGSSWDKTRVYGNGCAQVGRSSVIHVVEAEAQLRFDAIHDFFAGLRSATWTR